MKTYLSSRKSGYIYTKTELVIKVQTIKKKSKGKPRLIDEFYHTLKNFSQILLKIGGNTSQFIL